MAVPINIEGIGCIEVTHRSNSTGIRMRIGTDRKIKVSAAPSISYKDIVGFVKSKKDWIDETLNKLNKTSPKLLVFEAGQTYDFGFFRVEVADDGEEGSLSVRYQKGEEGEPNIAYLSCPKGFDCRESAQFQAFAHKTIDRVLKNRACQTLPDRLRQLADKHGFKYAYVDFNNAKKQWGNCSTKGRICLNIQLVRLPQELQDLVMLHELCHTVEMNHSAAFHALMNKVTGGRENELEKKLKTYSTFY